MDIPTGIGLFLFFIAVLWEPATTQYLDRRINHLP